MKARRLKLSAPAVRTREEMERLVGEICELTIRHDELAVRMDEESYPWSHWLYEWLHSQTWGWKPDRKDQGEGDQLKGVRERYEAELGTIQPELDARMALAQDWAEAHPEEFGSRKSIDLVHGSVGWRTGQPM